jgi:hypothetical protein
MKLKFSRAIKHQPFDFIEARYAYILLDNKDINWFDRPIITGVWGSNIASIRS